MRTNGSSGALFEISGFVPVNATWSEDVYFSEEGSPMLLTGLSFQMTFRKSEDDTSADITLSTADGTLSIENDDDGFARILRITATAGTFSGYLGDYVADIASQDADEVVTLWAHGIVTFTNNPVTF